MLIVLTDLSPLPGRRVAVAAGQGHVIATASVIDRTVASATDTTAIDTGRKTFMTSLFLLKLSFCKEVALIVSFDVGIVV